jgi:hypothetical protein
MTLKPNLDIWEEVKSGRADEAGANFYTLYSAVRKGDFKLIAVVLKSVIKNEDWKHWRWINQEFECGSLREFLFAHPPKGIGAEYNLLRRIVLDDSEAIEMLDQALQQPHGTNRFTSPSLDLYNIQDYKAPSGTSIEAALRRLRADERPIAKELHAKVLTGELSAHRAAVLAGYRKEPDPLKIIRRLIPKLTPEQRQQVIAWLQD